MKTCSKCREEKPTSEFHKQAKGRGGSMSICKVCDRARQLKRKTEGVLNPEAVAATAARGSKTCKRCKQDLPLSKFTRSTLSADGYRTMCRACNKDAWQRHKYGITQAEKERLLEAQGGVCAICGTDSPGPKDWHTDHCHTSLKVRGVLCDSCNKALGYAKESPEVLRTMASYIEMHAVT